VGKKGMPIYGKQENNQKQEEPPLETVWKRKKKN
jgi:hypothetical protein